MPTWRLWLGSVNCLCWNAFRASQWTAAPTDLSVVMCKWLREVDGKLLGKLSRQDTTNVHDL